MLTVSVIKHRIARHANQDLHGTQINITVANVVNMFCGKVGERMDREKVIKAYECCKNSFDRICEKCPYEKDCCHDGIPMFVIKEMVALLKEQQEYIEYWSAKYDEYGKAYMKVRDERDALLKEQEAVVRCKDCKYWDYRTEGCTHLTGTLAPIVKTNPDWYCADSEVHDD